MTVPGVTAALGIPLLVAAGLSTVSSLQPWAGAEWAGRGF